MEVMFVLIVASLCFALVFLFAFIWAVNSGQFEDCDTPAMQVLMEEASATNNERDSDER